MNENPYGPRTTKYEAVWNDAHKGVYARPVIQVSVMFDPDDHAPWLIEFELKAAANKIIEAIENDF